MVTRKADVMPFPATMQVLERGQERFNIYCTPCHSRVGNGDGMIVQRGYKSAGNFHDSARRTHTLGHYLLRHDQWLRRDAGLCRAVDAGRSLGRCGLHPRAATEPGCDQEKDVPAGAQVESLENMTEKRGFPASFAKPWELPPTAVQALHPMRNRDIRRWRPAGQTTAAAQHSRLRAKQHPPRRKRQLTPPVATKPQGTY